MSFWLAVPPVLLTIGLIYYTFYRILRAIYRDHLEWFIGVLIFLSPFGYILSQARSLVQVMWILLLTPFYAIFVLLLSATWVFQFYLATFAALLIFTFVRVVRKARVPSENPKFQVFLSRNLEGRSSVVPTKRGKIDKTAKKAVAFVQGLGKGWSLITAVVLLLILSTTLVSAATQVNPTYSQVQQFVASDNAHHHAYIEGSYTCINFATDFRSNALRAGYKCGFAFVYFPDHQSHALDCFNTTDRGLIFVEPQWDKFVNVGVGESYACGDRTLSLDNSTVIQYYVDFGSSPQIP